MVHTRHVDAQTGKAIEARVPASVQRKADALASLVTLCQVLSLEVGELFTQPDTHVVRLAEAPRISLGGEGIVERLVTARSERRLQVIRAVIAPHGEGEKELYSVDCEVEVLHVLSGRFVLIFANERFELDAGDTVTFPGREPHSWLNPTGEETVVTWTLVPAASR